MKFSTTRYTLALLLCSAVTFSSCDRGGVEIELPHPSAEAVSFRAAITTRATDTAFEADDEISVTAYTEAGDVHEANARYAYDGTIFTSENPIEFASNTPKLSFIALYPYIEMDESRIVQFDVAADQSEENAYTNSDLMRSYTAATNSTNPKLIFDHLLTKVVINITSTDVDMVNILSTLELKGGVEYNMATLSATAVGDAETITMAQNGVNSYKAVVAPQSVTEGAVLGTVNVDGDLYELYCEAEMELLAGKEYTLSATISDRRISFDTPVINGWDKGEFPIVEGTKISLAELSADSYPADDDVWVVTDAEADDFNNLEDALTALEGSGREITLRFVNLQSLPDGALAGAATLVAVDLPVATQIGGNALVACGALRSVSMPAVTTLVGNTLMNCASLTSLTLATAQDAELTSLDKMVLANSTTNCTLTVGAANSAYVSGNQLTLGDTTLNFKAIEVAE